MESWVLYSLLLMLRTYYQQVSLNIAYYQPVQVSLNNALHCLYRLKTGCIMNVLEFFLTSYLRFNRSNRLEVFCKKGVLRNFAKYTGKHLCQSLLFEACNFIKKETLAKVFFWEFCKISKNTFSYKTPSVAAAGLIHVLCPG